MSGKRAAGFDHGRRRWLWMGASAMAAVGLFRSSVFAQRSGHANAAENFAIHHSDVEWKALLTPEQYAVLRQESTERPFSSPLNHEKRSGTFVCAGCDNALFSSTTKFDSGTGWPSFWKPLPTAVNEIGDDTLGMHRTEVQCHRCGGHLGHVFDDGPEPTGQRYCMNGVALTFKADA